MINANGAFIRSMHYFDVETRNNQKILFIFSGLPLSQAEVESLSALDTGNGIPIQDIISLATSRGNQLLHSNFYDNFDPEYPGDKIMRWPLAERSDEFLHENDGVPGWFFFATTTVTHSRDTITAPLTYLGGAILTFFGSCGSHISPADLRVLGGVVDDRPYSTADLEITFA